MLSCEKMADEVNFELLTDRWPTSIRPEERCTEEYVETILDSGDFEEIYGGTNR